MRGPPGSQSVSEMGGGEDSISITPDGEILIAQRGSKIAVGAFGNWQFRCMRSADVNAYLSI
jgi:hypothetical protein